ncbi:MAG TPA: hypothetical protein VLV85_06450 [Stellaceae bacterium]|nr:hypothetical protein [Stellaceae bacterium]
MTDTEAVEADIPFRAVDDIGVRVPYGLAVDPEIESKVKLFAGIMRGAGIVMAAREIAANPSEQAQHHTVAAEGAGLRPGAADHR